ncbi:hypothetical protein [Pseudomonas sp. UBA6562]|uniref:hypothetical protein n=1 Tax=Pseudomonas sp. UBA6562 TaxID=1947332 RepID=UPI0025E2736F|nr:hypothetical protein [Pseudomonas sp. UBA6562]
MNYQHWMGDSPEIGCLRIDQLILPGSHDSGMDKEADSFTVPQEVTQDVPCIEQIQKGVRVLDLRVRANHEYTPDEIGRYKLYHANPSGRTVLGDVINRLNHFYDDVANQREIVILDFHELDHFSDSEHTWLQDMLRKYMGQRLIPYALHDLTLDQLWREHPGKTVVIAYHHAKRGEHWPGVEQVWMGENTPSTDELKAFMDKAASESRSGKLWSIQCAKYNKVVFTPDDFSDKVDLWFESRDLESYIQKFAIINTDWTLRSRLVDNCVHACRLRARSLSGG